MYKLTILVAALVPQAWCLYEPSLEVGRILAREYTPGGVRFPMEYGMGHYYQGDIILKPDQSRAGIIFQANRWPKGVVPYKVMANFSPLEWSVVQRAIQQYNNLTCIRFIPQTNEEFYVSFTKNPTGCHSNVGFNGDNQYHKINLQMPYCMQDMGTSVHEMLHALGALHEFTRSDRDQFITIDRSALLPQYQNDDFFQRNYALDPPIVSTFNVPYNYGSVMHYSRFAGSADPAFPVMMNKKVWFGDFGSSNGLTKTDVDLINKMYCDDPVVMGG